MTEGAFEAPDCNHCEHDDKACFDICVLDNEMLDDDDCVICDEFECYDLCYGDDNGHYCGIFGFCDVPCHQCEADDYYC